MDVSKLKVELRPHIGRQRTQVGDGVVEFDVDHKQLLVFCNGNRVGIYCGTKDQPGKHLSFTETLPQGIQDAITEQVKSQVGGQVGRVTAVPAEQHERTAVDDGE